MADKDGALWKIGKVLKTIGLGVVAGACKMVDEHQKSIGECDERIRNLYDISSNEIRKTWDMPEKEREVDPKEPIKLCQRRIYIKQEKLKKCHNAYEIARRNGEQDKMEQLEMIEADLREEIEQMKIELREIERAVSKSLAGIRDDDYDDMDE